MLSFRYSTSKPLVLNNIFVVYKYVYSTALTPILTLKEVKNRQIENILSNERES